MCFFFNDTATTEIYTLSLHDALPIFSYELENNTDSDYHLAEGPGLVILSKLKTDGSFSQEEPIRLAYPDRKSTRLNSSHSQISYAVFCLKKNNNTTSRRITEPSASSC